MHQSPTGKKKSNPALSQVKNILLISSGKGGVGKSTLTVQLAAAFQQLGKKVGVMDADIYGPNIHSMMGVVDSPRIEEVKSLGMEFFIPPQSFAKENQFGIKVMSMGFLVDSDQPLIWRGPKLHEVIRQFTHQIYWGELDYLLIDCPPGTGDVHLSLAQSLNVSGALLVTTPSEVSLDDVEKARLMWEKVNIPILGIIENMASFFCPNCTKEHFVFGHQEAQAYASSKNLPILLTLPLQTEIREGMDFGKPTQVSSPQSAVALQILHCAETLDKNFNDFHPAPEIQLDAFKRNKSKY